VRCTDAFDGLNLFDSLTAATSHEVVEAATDPYGDSPAFLFVDAGHVGWTWHPPTQEVADMCDWDKNSFGRVDGLDYAVERIWSNAAAAAGQDPCRPAPPGSVFFNGMPVLNQVVPIRAPWGGWSGQTLGVPIAVGTSATIDVQLFSSGPTTPWKVRGADLSTLEGGEPELAFAFDREEGSNGDTLHATITVLRSGPYGGSEFAIISERGTDMNVWFGFVAN
jgi:hypothetical protein